MLKQSNYFNHYHQMMNNSSHQHTQQLLNNQIKLSLNNLATQNDSINGKNYRIIVDQKKINQSTKLRDSPIFMNIKNKSQYNTYNNKEPKPTKSNSNYVIKYPVMSSSSSISSETSSFIHSPIKTRFNENVNNLNNATNLYDEIQYYECIPIKIVNRPVNNMSINENNKLNINCFKNNVSRAAPPPVPSSTIPSSLSTSQLNKTFIKSSCYGASNQNTNNSNNSHYYHSYNNKAPSSKSGISLSVVNNLDKIASSLNKIKQKSSKLINTNLKQANLKSSPTTLCSSGYDSSHDHDLSSCSLSSSSSNSNNKINNSKATTILSYCSINHDHESKQKYLDSLKHKQLNQILIQQQQQNNIDMSASSFLSTKSILNSNKSKNLNKSIADSGIFTLSNNTNSSDSSIADATSNISSVNDNTSLLSSPYHLSTSLSSCSSTSIKSAELDADDEDNNLDSFSQDLNNIKIEASPFPKVKTCLIAHIKQINNNDINTSSSKFKNSNGNIKNILSNASSDSFYENLCDSYNNNNNNYNNNSIKKNYSISDVLHSLKSLESTISSNSSRTNIQKNITKKYDYQDDDFMCDREVESILNRPTSEEYEMYHQHQQFNQIKNQPIKQYYNLNQHLKQLTKKSINTGSGNINVNIYKNNSSNSCKSYHLQPFWEQLV